MKRDGTARVEIAPIEVPQREGGTRSGAGADGRDATRPNARGVDGGGPGEGRGR
jgi:hypothetical protein